MASKKKNPEVAMIPDSFWDRPAAREKGDTDANAIYLEVGRALSTWESGEEALSSLCLFLSDNKMANRKKQRSDYGARLNRRQAAETPSPPWQNYISQTIGPSIAIDSID